MRKLNLISILFVSLLSVSCVAQDSQKYNWSEIKEFKFYGRNNPLNNIDSNYVDADIEIISEILVQSRKSEGYFPKGAQNYASIIFNDSKTITIQILPGLPGPIRVVEGKLFDDDWFEFDDEMAQKWLAYIRQLNEQLNK